MIKKFLIASLAALMVLGISLTAFADEEDPAATQEDSTTEQGYNPAGYNEYGLSYAAMDALTISLEEATTKYAVDQVIPEDGYTTVIFQNGFTMDYYDGWTDLYTDTDDGGKNLFYYFDITVPTVDAVAALLAEKGYSVIYDYVDNADLPINTCAVDSVSQSVKINAGFPSPIFWDINSESQGQMNASYSYADNPETVEG